MLRSFYSGVSGMTANTISLDVIGNNIANSNTVGFKSGRASFSEMLYQTLQGGTEPQSSGLGGTNPLQVGLGTRIGSIDTFFNQGTFQTTGKKTDLALDGNGFFVLSDGFSRAYTRAGIFGLDSDSYFVDPATGLRVQGVMADDLGNIGTGPFEDIYIDPDLTMAASASTLLEVAGNLPAGGDGQGSILRSESLLASANGTDRLVDVRGQNGGDLGLRAGDVIMLGGMVGNTNLGSTDFTVTDATTYAELVRWLNNQAATSGNIINFSLAADGSIEVTNGGPGDIQSLALVVGNRPGFNANLHFDSLVQAGSSSSTASLRAVATAQDRLVDLYDSNGNSLGLTAGSSTVDLGGLVGGTTVSGATLDVQQGTTLGSLLGALESAFVLSTPATVDGEGRITMTGDVGTAHALDGITVSDSTTGGTLVDFTGIQDAVDPSMATVATTVTDALGNVHSVRLDFAKIPGVNEWTWTATMEGGETIASGGSGRVAFNSDGTLAGLTYDDGAGALTFQAAGTDPVTLALEFGSGSGLDGLTQFATGGSVSALSDGYGAGTLIDFEIGTDGVITGIFSNDTTQALAQIGISRFANPDGLSREANNTFRIAANSGDPVDMFAGAGTGVSMHSGALEASNVDLAKEFTDLVVAQRSFQANSKVVSTADEVLQELISLLD